VRSKGETSKLFEVVLEDKEKRDNKRVD